MDIQLNCALGTHELALIEMPSFTNMESLHEYTAVRKANVPFAVINRVSLRLTWHAHIRLYKGYFYKALSSVAEGPAYTLRVVR